MRIAYSAVVALLVIGAVPPVGVAQVLTLDQHGYRWSLDHAVPVATVSLVGDIVALGGARVVQDTYGEPFVLGAATLDVTVPGRAKVVFTMTNATEMPIRLKDVLVYERTMVSSTYLRGVTVGAPYMPLSVSGVIAGNPPKAGEELQPGASLTVEMPISAPLCHEAQCQTDGFIVFVGRKLPHGDTSLDPTGRAWLGENPLFTRAFLALVSPAQQ
jgi:hypothetical protein